MSSSQNTTPRFGISGRPTSDHCLGMLLARDKSRMDELGRMYGPEANPNPQLAYGEDFTESAERMGIKYPQLIQRILMTGLRWKADRMG